MIYVAPYGHGEVGRSRFVMVTLQVSPQISRHTFAPARFRRKQLGRPKQIQ